MTSSPAKPLLPKFVGERIKRREDPRLIQGLGTYVDDVKPAGLLHVAFKRSDIAHGEIRRLDTTAAKAMPGVERVVAGAELAELVGSIPVATAYPAPEHFPLAVDRVRHVGEPVALVVARDFYIARDAVDALVIEYNELPAVIDAETAEQSDTLVHEGFANNIAVRAALGTDVDPATQQPIDDSAIEGAFASADVVVSQRMVNQRLAPTPIEPRGVVAHYEPGREYLTIWSSTQNPHLLRTRIAQALELGEHQVRAVAPEVGGGFGCKISAYGEEYALAAVSKLLGQPVKWIEDRSEAFVATSHGRDMIGTVDIAATRDGDITALRLRLLADMGAYEMLLSALLPTFTAALVGGVYNIPIVRSEITQVFTNKTPTDAYRGAGRPESQYFVERAVDMLARELEMDPAELRRRNFFQPDEFPVTTVAGGGLIIYDSGDYERTLEVALETASWNELIAERDAARSEGRLVGVGLSYYVEVCGAGPSFLIPMGGWEHASVTVERGGKITATTGASPHGQGHETTFSQMLADHFGVPMEDIAIVHGDTAVVKQGIGTWGSRSQAVGGTVLMLAAEKVSEKMRRFAAAMMAPEEVAPDGLVFAGGEIVTNDSPAIARSFTEVADFAHVPVPLPAGLSPGLSEEAFWEPEGVTYPFGCHISMIEIDRETGESRLLKMIAVDDCGNVINPLIVDGQIHGGLAQGIGQAMFEELIYDEQGQPVSASFLEYVMPRAADLPRFELERTVTPTPLNPMGAKGIGEAGTIGSTPCVVNAAVDALAPLGVRHVDMPLKPERLWRLIGNGGEA